MTSLHDLTALEQAAAIRRREVSPVELVEHYLGRIDRLDAMVGAYLTPTPDLALRQAREAERHLAASRRDGGAGLEPLFGVPVPVKDLTAVAGVRWTLGSAACAELVAEADDHVVTRLRAAGTVMLGKTNTPEFGMPCYTENAIAPPARTPYDLGRSACGSSGGAAAAVATGLAPVAHGSDGGGSVRGPAATCGLVGLKPSRGRISGVPLEDVTGLLTHGALARTVADAAALLDVMAGPAPGDSSAPLPPPGAGSFLAHATGVDPGRLRIGRHRSPVLAGTGVHPDCVAAYDQAATLLEKLGHEVEDVEPPFGAETVGAFEVVWHVAARLVPVPPDREQLLTPLTRWHRSQADRVGGHVYAAGLTAMRAAARRALIAYEPYDVILTPTLAAPPAPVGGIRDDADPARDFERQKAFSPFSAVWNITGQPAVSLPLYWNADGMPIGTTLAGRPGGEAGLLALAAQLESAEPWRVHHPSLW